MDAPVWTTKTGWRWIEVVVFGACLVLAAAMRLDAIRAPLSFDEVWVLDGTAGKGGRVLPSDRIMMPRHSLSSLAAPDVPAFTWRHGVPFHPPLHPATLRLWREWVCDGDAFARLYSGLWSMVAIVFVGLTVRAQVGSGLACLTVAILAVAPVQIHLGTELRGYAMALAMTGAAVWLAVRIEQAGLTTRRLVALGGLTLPLMLTHYLAAGSCLAILAWGALRLPRRAFLQLCGVVVMAGVVFVAVWGWALLQDTLTGIPRFLQRDSSPWYRLVLSGVLLPWRMLVYLDSRWLAVAMGTALAIPVPLVLFRRAPQAVPWVLFLAIPPLGLLVLDLVRGSQLSVVPRYAATMSVAIPAALLVAVAAVNRRAAWLSGGVLLAAVLASRPCCGRQIGSPFFHPIVDRFVPLIRQEASDLPMVIRQRPVGSLGYYAHGLTFEFLHAGLVDRPYLLLEGDEGIRALLEQLPEQGRFWMVTDDEGPVPPGVPPPLDTASARLEVVAGPIRQARGPGGFSERPGGRLYLVRRFSGDGAHGVPR